MSLSLTSLKKVTPDLLIPVIFSCLTLYTHKCFFRSVALSKQQGLECGQTG